MVSGIEYLLVGVAALAAGAVNALAGGGTLITFPTLTAVGIPAVAANVTNTIALCPGYLGASLGQARDLRGQWRRRWMLLPAGVVGGLAGGVLLLNTDDRIFGALVPWLILLASALLAAQAPLRRWLVRHPRHAGASAGALAVLAVGVAAVYGGYFGAGLGVVLLAVLGLTLDDTLTRLNALKQVLSLVVNVAAAVLFVFSGEAVWPVAAVMAAGSVLGGALGARLASRVEPELLRRVVVLTGVCVAVVYLVR